MNYKGFELTPVGSAKIEIAGGRIHVTNIGESGLDGILINTTGHANYKIFFSEFSNLVGNRGIVKYTTLFRDYRGRVITGTEQFDWYDPETNMVYFGYNKKLLPDSFRLVGKLEDKIIFSFDENRNSIIDPRPPAVSPPASDHDTKFIGEIIQAVAEVGRLALDVYKEFKGTKKTKTTKIYDAQGRLIATIVEETTDPVPFEIEVQGKKYTIDEISIEYGGRLDRPLINPGPYNYDNAGTMVQASKINEFTILNIERLPE